jgi:hypothetical protein
MTKLTDDLWRYVQVRPKENYACREMPSKHDDQLGARIDTLRSEASFSNATAALRGIGQNLLPEVAPEQLMIIINDPFSLVGLAALVVLLTQSGPGRIGGDARFV